MVLPVVIVHGGAWAIPQKLWDIKVSGVKEAALKGYKVGRVISIIILTF